MSVAVIHPHRHATQKHAQTPTRKNINGEERQNKQPSWASWFLWHNMLSLFEHTCKRTHMQVPTNTNSVSNKENSRVFIASHMLYVWDKSSSRFFVGYELLSVCPCKFQPKTSETQFKYQSDFHFSLKEQFCSSSAGTFADPVPGLWSSVILKSHSVEHVTSPRKARSNH